jgi:hypothetical protein
MRPLRSLARLVRPTSGALLALLCLLPGLALGQQSLLQGGSMTAGHLPMYSIGGTSQPIVIDSGPAGGNVTGQGISELNVTARGTGTPPYATQGTGPNGEIACFQDAVSTNSTGYHYLCLSPNAAGGGLLSYGAAGGASSLPFTFMVNGTSYAFPFVTGGIVGPGSTTVGHMACWNNTAGTLLSDCGTALTIGGSANQIQYNNAGALGGFTLGGDATVNVGTGALTITKIGGQNATLGGALSTAGALTTGGPFITSGASSLTLTTSGATNVSLPASGTLATLAGSEALTNKTVNGLTITSTTGGTLTIANNKVLTASNTLTFTGTDGSTLAIGTGGTLGTAAYTAATAYMPSGVQITNTLGADVAMNNAANYFDGPSVAQGSTGTWFASGTVTVAEGTVAGAGVFCKLWDGTNVIASGAMYVQGASSDVGSLSLSGYRASPAGNIRISCRSPGSITGNILFNQTGNSKDSTITAFRVQ